MITEADHDNWKAEELKPYIDAAIECFGFDRLIYGGDWPVCRRAGPYLISTVFFWPEDIRFWIKVA
jgi:L-fuconolactonase